MNTTSGRIATADSTSGTAISVPSDFIDLKRYPVADRGSSGYKELVEFCRAQLKDNGACVLEGFIKDSAVKAMAIEAETLAPLAFHNVLIGNAYLTELDSSLPADHPRNLTETTALGAVAYDQIPPDALLRRLYEWDTLMEFLGDALGKEKLYRYADPMGALNIAVMKEGDYLRWHFDQTDFVTTILLQPSEAGGEYEFIPMIRSSSEENYEAVKAALQGSREGVITLQIEPGSLVLFEGRHSLHRVTPIEGQRLRLIALLGYDTKPGVVSSDYLRKIRYGRTESIQR